MLALNSEELFNVTMKHSELSSDNLSILNILSNSFDRLFTTIGFCGYHFLDCYYSLCMYVCHHMAAYGRSLFTKKEQANSVVAAKGKSEKLPLLGCSLLVAVFSSHFVH